MKPLLRPALLVLLLAFALAPAARAQAVGLDFPARATAGPGRLSAGAYVGTDFIPRLVPGLGGYLVQPYVRYLLGQPGRVQPFIQYNFAPYLVQSVGGAAPGFAPGSTEPVASPGLAPLGLPSIHGNGGLQGFSMGVPVRLGAGGNRLMLNVGTSVLGGLRR